MHKNLPKLIVIMMIWCTLSSSTNSETAYITEKLEIPVRSGESRDYRIIRYLEGGTEIEILQTFDSGYTKIKDKKGREGFVLGRYLEKTLPSFLLASRLEAQVAKYKETTRQLRKNIKILTAQGKSSEQSVKDIKHQLDAKEVELSDFLSRAGDSTALRNRLFALETERQALISDNETLLAEKLAIVDDSSKTWFALGAFIIAFGWFIGMLMPRMRKSRVDTNL